MTSASAPLRGYGRSFRLEHPPHLDSSRTVRPRGAVASKRWLQQFARLQARDVRPVALAHLENAGDGESPDRLPERVAGEPELLGKIKAVTPSFDPV